MTYDSHACFGAGGKSNSRIAIDDVYYWGGDFADIYVYDLYPYMMYDFRYGEFGKLPKPRLSQMHYTIAQMRNLATSYKKDMGFWFGTYNKTWFPKYMTSENEQSFWLEREMSYSAIANGANFIITGINIPESAKHWEDLGQAMNTIQKAGPGLTKAPKVKAKACFIFPRTQYLQLQEEYFNVGLSFELFLRSFGELDIIHEDQVREGQLSGYNILILCDVKLLPVEVAQQIVHFVKNGGVVISDCVPQMDAFKAPMEIMNGLFGISRAETDRVIQEGFYDPQESLTTSQSAKKIPEIKLDTVFGQAFGEKFQFKIVSPRAISITSGNVELTMKSGHAGLVSNHLGKGKAYLFGFCMQDTYFQTWKDSSSVNRSNLMGLISKVFKNTGVQPNIWSSNPGIEATIRANSKEGYVFVINHEESNPSSVVKLGKMEFLPAKLVDIETGLPVDFIESNGGIEFVVHQPIGRTQILKIETKK